MYVDDIKLAGNKQNMNPMCKFFFCGACVRKTSVVDMYVHDDHAHLGPETPGAPFMRVSAPREVLSRNADSVFHHSCRCQHANFDLH